MKFPLRIYSRIVLELTSPCNIGVGTESVHSDQPFIVDVNGLPTLPGSSLAGMLRSAFRQASNEDNSASGEQNSADTNDMDERARDDRWFGFATGQSGLASKVRFSWGHVHDDSDCPVEEHILPSERSAFLNQLASGTKRDFVRLSHLGAVHQSGKFDRDLVFTGTRFTFDLEIVGRQDDALEKMRSLRDELLKLLHSPTTRLGGATHAGMGGFKLVRVHSGEFDLQNAPDFEAYSRLPVRLDQPTQLQPLTVSSFATHASTSNAAKISVKLRPETFFLFGGGAPPQPESEGAKTPKINPVRQQTVSWQANQGQLNPNGTLFIPASAIKGALSHRVAFHYNRRAGIFAEDIDSDPVNASSIESKVGESNLAVRELFGFCKDNAGAQAGGQIGRVLIEDIDLASYESHQRTLTHTSIDSLTAGVRNRMLFSERALTPKGPEIKFDIVVEKPHQIDPIIAQSLRDALNDLIQGRLAVGNGQSRGNGHFQGEYQWPAQLVCQD